MTPRQVREHFRSLRYRQRLQASMGRKEAELIAYIQERGGVAVIDGCRVTFKDGGLIWEELPKRTFQQLPLFREEVSYET